MRNFHRHKIHEKENSDHFSSHSFDKFFFDSRDGRARDSVSGFLLVLKENKRKATARQVSSHWVASNIRHESDRPDEADCEGTRNSRCVSSSCKIKLNKHDCRAGERENVLGGKPKQAKRRAFSHVRRSAVTSHPFFSTLWGNVLCVRWVNFSFSARSGYQLSLSELHFLDVTRTSCYSRFCCSSASSFFCPCFHATRESISLSYGRSICGAPWITPRYANKLFSLNWTMQ